MGCARGGVPLLSVSLTGKESNMRVTTYTCVETVDLVNYALCRDNSSELEIELAQRLSLALDMLEEDEPYTRRSCQGCD